MLLNGRHSLAALLSSLVTCLHLSQAVDPDPDHQQSALLPDILSSTHDPISNLISSSPLLSFHRSICQIESITNNEHTVAHYLYLYLKKHNFHVLRQEVPRPSGTEDRGKRVNIFAWPGDHCFQSSFNHSAEHGDAIGDFAPEIIVTSHIDTVPPFLPYSASAPSSFPTVQGEDFNRSKVLISGRGTVDAKASVAAQVHALLSLRPSHQCQRRLHSVSDQSTSSLSTSGSTLPVALLFVVGEEDGGDGMREFSSSPLHRHLSRLANPYRAVIFGEPTESRLASGHKGVLIFKLRARGKAAHSGYPWLGRSANSMIIPVLAAVDRLGDLPEAEGGLPRSDKYGNSTVNIGLIKGGIASNVVAEEAEAEVLVRLAGGTPENARRIIHQAVKAVNQDVAVDFMGAGYAPVDLDADVDGFPTVTVNYGTDIPHLDIGRPAVKRYLYGPGSILVAHGDHEGLTVGDLEAAVEGYKRLILATLRR